MKKAWASIVVMVLGCGAQAETSSSHGSLNASSYAPADAVQYADSHWDDGQGECAEFVSRSLIAGHAQTSVITWVPYLVSALASTTYEEHYAGETPNAAAGDVVVYSDAVGDAFCNDDSDGYNCGHTCIVAVGGSGEGNIAVDCHNNAHHHLPLGDILGGGYSAYRIYHLASHPTNMVVGCSTDDDCNHGVSGTQDVCAATEHYCIRACHGNFDCPYGYTCTATSPHWSCQ